MAQLKDYMLWRGDIIFSVKEFNEVDNLVLSELAYFDYGQMLTGEDKELSLREVCEKYVALDNPTKYYVNNPVPLLRMAAASERYAEIKVSDYKAITDKDRQIQFAAITFLLSEKEIFVAFRGTDSSVVGWREDLDLSYMEETPSQTEATKYLNEIMQKYKAEIKVGGHSKGGNLAVYAAAFCKEGYRSRVNVIYSNDGPGFNDLIKDKPELLAVYPKVLHFIPKSAVVGTYLKMNVDYIVIESTGKNGIEQHNPYCWNVKRDHFARVKQKTKTSILLDGTLEGWIMETPIEERKTFIDSIFGVLGELDADTLEELGRHKWNTLITIIKASHAKGSNVRKELLQAVKRIVVSGKNVIKKPKQQ